MITLQPFCCSVSGCGEECIAGAVLDTSTGIAGAARGIVGAALALSVLSCCSGGDKEGTMGVVSADCDAEFSCGS